MTSQSNETPQEKVAAAAAETKATETKAVEAEAVEIKPADTKAADAKAADTKAAEAKAAPAKPAKPAKKQKPTEKLAEFALAHGGLSMAATALVVCASLILLVWFILYSGISSSADFIYAQF